MGSRAYTLAGTLDYQPGEVILEIGSERGEGSTVYLASLGPPLVTIDVNPDWMPPAVWAASGGGVAGYYMPPHVHFWAGLAEDLLPHWQSTPAITGGGAAIRFAWLDGHDWPYDGIDPVEAKEWARIYEARGQEFTRDASARSHLTIARLIAPWVPPGGVIAIDDTSYLGSGRWDGKGRDAVPWLLSQAPFLIRDGGIGDGWVALVKEP